VAAFLFSFVGCGGGPIEEGIPPNAEYKPVPIPDAVKGNMGAKVPKAGTPAPEAATPETPAK